MPAALLDRRVSGPASRIAAPALQSPTAVAPSSGLQPAPLVVSGSASGHGQSPAPADAIITELLALHLTSMYRLARSIVHDQSLAEDVVQESLIKAWQAASTYRGDASVRSWALRITHNTAISVLRKRREDSRDPALLPEPTESQIGVDREVHGRMMVDDLWKALDGLDPLSRTITVLREIEGMSYDEIAEVLELPLPTVKTRLFRARRHLATTLEDWR